MRILFVQPTSDKQGHYGIYSVRVNQNLAALGHDVTLYTNALDTKRYMTEQPLFSCVEHAGGKYAFAPCENAGNAKRWRYLYSYIRNSFVILRGALRRAARDGGYDVIQITDCEFLVTALLLKWYAKKIPPVCILLHAANFSFKEYDGGLLKKCYKAVQSAVFRSCVGHEIKSIITLGNYHRERLEAQLQIGDTCKVHVVYDGADIPDTIPQSTDARVRLGIPDNATIFLLFGMMRRDKGIEYLLKALEGLEGSWRLLMAGAPADYLQAELAELIKEAGLTEKVITVFRFLEPAEVPLFFAASDCVVFPYRRAYRGGTGPLMKEAAPHRRPVIATRVSEMGSIVARHNIGFVAEPEDVASLQQALRNFILTDSEQRRAFGDRISALAQSWRALATAYANVYGDMRNRAYVQK